MTKRKTTTSAGDEHDNYAVGYRKPPTDTQFRPGQSGNSAGRRKGVRNLKTDVKRALATRVNVKRGSAARRQSAQETLLMLALEQALRGDARARDRLLDLASRFNNDAVEAGPEQPISADDRAILENDLAGHLLEQGIWEHLNLPAIAFEDSVIAIGGGKTKVRRIGDVLHPKLESKDTLDRIKAESGSLKFAAQYQQRPVPIEGNLIRRAWFRYYDQLPQGSARRIVQSWDTAMMTGDANDYSVCTTWWIIKSDYYLIDVFRARLQYPDLRRKVGALAAMHGVHTVLIENAGPGGALLQDLRSNLPRGMPYPIGRKPDGSKADRMVAQSAKIEAGHVFLPREAEWLDTFLHEVLGFPGGRHDDQVDSVSQFLQWAAKWDAPDFVMIGEAPKVFVGGIQVN